MQNGKTRHMEITRCVTKFEIAVCGRGWSYSNHTRRCYKHFTELKSWTDARAYCQARAPHTGDLASVPDQDTNLFLSSLTSETVWIGGYQKDARDGAWGWSDGTAWGFESWCPGEPNNFGGYAEDYLATNFCSPGGWNDFTVSVNSTFNSGFICQYEN